MGERGVEEGRQTDAPALLGQPVFVTSTGTEATWPPSLPVISVSEVGAKIYGANLGVMYYGVEVPATSTPPRISASHLGAKICGAETCYFGARTHGADPQGPKMSLSLSESQM